MKGDNTIGFYDEKTNSYRKENGGEGEIYMNFTAFENKSDKVCYIPELNDTKYTYNDFVRISKGNINLAKILFEMVEWQSPEVIFNELVDNGEIDENGTFLIWKEGNKY